MAAHNRLDAAQRGRVGPQGLAVMWEAREGTHGPTDNFRVTGFSSKNGRTRVSGTLRYRDGATELRTVWPIKEGGVWQIASDP